MRLRRLKKALPRVKRLGIVLPTLAAYLLVALGIPCPAIARVIKDTRQPFPCQSHLCGCMNAEQFWAGCCCLTLSERLAWAKANHVTPPAWVIEPTPHDSASEEKLSCCSSHSSGECKKPCCAKKAPAKKTPASASPVRGKQAALPNTGKPLERWVGRQCGGMASYWLTASLTGPPDAWHTWHYEWTPAEWVPFLHISSEQFSSVPVPPPPRG